MRTDEAISISYFTRHLTVSIMPYNLMERKCSYYSVNLCVVCEIWIIYVYFFDLNIEKAINYIFQINQKFICCTYNFFKRFPLFFVCKRVIQCLKTLLQTQLKCIQCIHMVTALLWVSNEFLFKSWHLVQRRS